MENKFATWLTSKLDELGWSNRELARRAGITHSAISMLISGTYNPGLDFCLGIARAFKLPPEEVLRKAELIPDLPAPNDDPTLEELYTYLKHLDRETRQEILEYVLFRYQRQRGSSSVPSTGNEANAEASA